MDDYIYCGHASFVHILYSKVIGILYNFELKMRHVPFLYWINGTLLEWKML